MAHLDARIGTTAYAVAIIAGRHSLASDEPPGLGGADAGPSPYELLLASLAACTLITLRMYADRKQWPVRGIAIALDYSKPGDRGRIDRSGATLHLLIFPRCMITSLDATSATLFIGASSCRIESAPCSPLTLPLRGSLTLPASRRNFASP